MNTVEELQPVRVMWLTGGMGIYRLMLEPTDRRPYYVMIDEFRNRKTRIPPHGVQFVQDVTEAEYAEMLREIKEQTKRRNTKLITPM